MEVVGIRTEVETAFSGRVFGIPDFIGIVPYLIRNVYRILIGQQKEAQ
jgi:hypothetical protein